MKGVVVRGGDEQLRHFYSAFLVDLGRPLSCYRRHKPFEMPPNVRLDSDCCCKGQTTCGRYLGVTKRL